MKMRDNPNNMESFYEENAAQLSGQTPIITSAGGVGGHGGVNGLMANGAAAMKRPLTLDLNGKDQHPAKRLRFNNSLNVASVISSPDLQMLKMASPELEKFIMNGNSIATPTPSIMYPQKVTQEEQNFVKGFEDALIRLRGQDGQLSGKQAPTTINNNNNNIINNNTNSSSILSSSVPSSAVMTTTISTNNTLSMSGGTVTYTNLDVDTPVVIKDEPQTVPNSPSFCPVDMDDQERQKLERKRQRNRIAASKCRKRKLERISKLEDKVKLLKGENSDLGSVVMNLKQHVIQLKQQIIEHVNAGCRIPIQQF